MLVLARKKNETIVINEEIVVQVLQIKGSTIRLGISAPQDVRIVRGELEPLESSAEGYSVVIDSVEIEETNSEEATGESQRPKNRPVRSTTGLNRFLKSANQVGEESGSSNSDASNPNYSTGSYSGCNYKGAMPSNRLKVLSSDDQCPAEVRESSTSYRAMCEIELPMTQFRSNQN